MIKQYIEYKPVTLFAIGKVPAHWEELRLKNIGQLFGGLSGKSGDDFRNELSECSKPYIPFKNIAGNLIIDNEQLDFVQMSPDEKQNIVLSGDLLFLMSSENFDDIGKTALYLGSHEVIYLNSFCKGFRPISDKVYSKFLNYLLNADEFRKALSKEAKGFTRINLQIGKIENLGICLPTLSEQTKIAEFLDHQTSLIDTIISKKEKLIELLKEKRLAVINEAVTKGLDPKVKMKDSGIEWLGEIPEKWVKRDLQTVVLNNQYSLTGGPFGSDLKHEEYTEEGVQIIQLNNIGVGEFKNDNQIFTSEEKADQLVSCNIFPGDIIVAKMADPVARACIMPDFDKRYLMASDGIRLEVNKDQFNTKFLEYAINANYFNLQAELNSTGTTRLRIGLTTFKKLKLVTPELEEQNQIVDYLEEFNSRFQSIVTMTKQQIDKLKAYRESLISEAVTGKIDVRDWEPLKSTIE